MTASRFRETRRRISPTTSRVDLLAEPAGHAVIAVEVKAGAAPARHDARHLAWLRDQLGGRFAAGVVLHTGPRVFELGDRILAVPIAALWA